MSMSATITEPMCSVIYDIGLMDGHVCFVRPGVQGTMVYLISFTINLETFPCRVFTVSSCGLHALH